jgi:hypothetical protein
MALAAPPRPRANPAHDDQASRMSFGRRPLRTSGSCSASASARARLPQVAVVDAGRGAAVAGRPFRAPDARRARDARKQVRGAARNIPRSSRPALASHRASMRSSILGPVGVRAAGEVVAPGGARRRGLPGIVFLHATEPASTPELRGQVWDEEAPSIEPQGSPRTELRLGENGRFTRPGIGRSGMLQTATSTTVDTSTSSAAGWA